MLFNMTIALLVVKIDDPPFNTIFFPRHPPPYRRQKNSRPPHSIPPPFLYLMIGPLNLFCLIYLVYYSAGMKTLMLCLL